MNNKRNQDERLIEEFLAGNPKACDMIRHWIFSWLRQFRWVNDSDREDVAQNILIELWSNLKKDLFRFDCRLKTFVFRMTKYNCIDYLRKRSRKNTIFSDALEYKPANQSSNPEKKLEISEEFKIYSKILELIPHKCLDLWRMILDEKMTYQQIADKFHLSVGTIKARAWGCRQKALSLRKIFHKRI